MPQLRLSTAGHLTLNRSATRAILGQADFSYLGYYDYGGSSGVAFGQGFTHRYVGGELRFLTTTLDNGWTPRYRLVEHAAPASLGGSMGAPVTTWTDPNGGLGLYAADWSQDVHYGIAWDEPTQRLWSTEGIDYPGSTAQDEAVLSIATRSLVADGTMTDVRGHFGMTGINQRRIYGGMCRVPSWFQSTYGVGPFAVGFGGYASRLTVGPVSLGPTLYAVPDPATATPDTPWTTGQFATLMDHGLGVASTATDWYTGTGATSPTDGDRGVRNSSVINHYDGGTYLADGSLGEGTVGDWGSPAPDGLGRWVWGDSSNNTGCWVDGSNRHGFLIVPTLNSGHAWYESSTGHRNYFTYEIQVFDPAHLGEVALGTRQPWDVRPTNRWELAFEGLDPVPAGTSFADSGDQAGIVRGASYDAVAGRLYVFLTVWAGGPLTPLQRVYVYSVSS